MSTSVTTLDRLRDIAFGTMFFQGLSLVQEGSREARRDGSWLTGAGEG